MQPFRSGSTGLEIHVIPHNIQLDEKQIKEMEDIVTDQLRAKFGPASEFIISDHMGERSSNKQKVLKTLPIRAGWKKALDNMLGMTHEAAKMMERANSLKKLFWAQVEVDTLITGDMRYNEKNNEIEVLSDNLSEQAHKASLDAKN